MLHCDPADAPRIPRGKEITTVGHPEIRKTDMFSGQPEGGCFSPRGLRLAVGLVINRCRRCFAGEVNRREGREMNPSAMQVFSVKVSLLFPFSRTAPAQSAVGEETSNISLRVSQVYGPLARPAL